MRTRVAGANPVPRRSLRSVVARKLGKMLLRLRVARRAKDLLDFAFDHWHGTRTSGIIELGNLSIRSNRKDAGTFYVATPRYEFRNIVTRLGLDPANHVFIDFGCGMGRVLLYAMDQGFSEVVGVEFSEDLAEIARKNVAIYGKRFRGRMEVITGDAAEFVIPKHPCVLYFFNPFSSAVTGEVLANIHRAHLAGNDTISIVWYNITGNARPLFDAPWLEVVAGEKSCDPPPDENLSVSRLSHLTLPYSIFRIRGRRKAD